MNLTHCCKCGQPVRRSDYRGYARLSCNNMLCRFDTVAYVPKDDPTVGWQEMTLEAAPAGSFDVVTKHLNDAYDAVYKAALGVEPTADLTESVYMIGSRWTYRAAAHLTVTGFCDLGLRFKYEDDDPDEASRSCTRDWAIRNWVARNIEEPWRHEFPIGSRWRDRAGTLIVTGHSTSSVLYRRDDDASSLGSLGCGFLHARDNWCRENSPARNADPRVEERAALEREFPVGSEWRSSCGAMRKVAGHVVKGDFGGWVRLLIGGSDTWNLGPAVVLVNVDNIKMPAGNVERREYMWQDPTSMRNRVRVDQSDDERASERAALEHEFPVGSRWLTKWGQTNTVTGHVLAGENQVTGWTPNAHGVLIGPNGWERSEVARRAWTRIAPPIDETHGPYTVAAFDDRERRRAELLARYPVGSVWRHSATPTRPFVVQSVVLSGERIRDGVVAIDDLVMLDAVDEKIKLSMAADSGWLNWERDTVTRQEKRRAELLTKYPIGSVWWWPSGCKDTVLAIALAGETLPSDLAYGAGMKMDDDCLVVLCIGRKTFRAIGTDWKAERVS